MGSTDAARRAGSNAANDEQMKSKMIVVASLKRFRIVSSRLFTPP
jgi:hypothetical protein